MKKRLEKDINPIQMCVGDTLHVYVKETTPDGIIETTEHIVDEIERHIEINKIITFDVEKGDLDVDVQDGIGAAFVNVKKKKKNKAYANAIY